MSGSLRWGLILLGGLCLMAFLPPPIDPVEQVDPPASLHRAPGTVLLELRLANGRILLADEVAVRGEEVRILRRNEAQVLPRSEVSNLTEAGTVESRRFFLLGSDRFGRDIWSRVMAGARVSLSIGLLAMLLASTLGTFVGAVAATAGPRLDNLLMRLVDGAMAFPSLFLVLGLSAILEPNTVQVVLLLGGTAWMGTSRLARAEILGLRERDFVLASRGIGQSRLKILWRHLLPNALTPLVVDATLMIGNLILAEAALSFFGLGVQAPTPSWGNMISDGRAASGVWWAAFFPGVAIAITVITLNLLADGLRKALDPRSREVDLPVEKAPPGTGAATLRQT
ncbi:MAG: ABC transporter permease [Acidobacteria bacterium]|nr:ABC transporter permease [Acidobacteriota bacterium]